jgi:hypothetical protein
VPVVRGSQTGGTDVAPPEVTGPVVPDPGVYQPTWFAPDGTTMALNPVTTSSGATRFSLKTVGGLGAVPVDPQTTPSILGGVVIDFIRPKERTINWPLRIRADTHTGFLEEWHRVLELFTQTRRLGPGRLRLVRPDGSAREIIASYIGGMEGDPDEGAWLTASPVVQLLCPEGFWRDTAPVHFEQQQESAGDYLNPYPSIGSGRIIGAATWVNNGQADAWPTWTIRGPMTAITATNVTRNQSFTVTYTLTAGQTLTIQSQPIRVLGPTGLSVISSLNLLAGGKPWRLDAKKSSSVNFTVAGAAAETSPGAGDGTKISADFVQRWESA